MQIAKPDQIPPAQKNNRAEILVNMLVDENFRSLDRILCVKILLEQNPCWNPGAHISRWK